MAQRFYFYSVESALKYIDIHDYDFPKNRKGKEIKDDLHYSGEGYKVFGERMAAEAIKRIKGE